MEGTKIGSYRLTRKLGEGGMGAVYLAESESLSTRKAVKVLLAELSADPAMMARFRNEAQAVADLQHDNIIGIDEFAQLPNGQWFIMMPFLEGSSLSSFLTDRGPLGMHMTLHILAQVGAALHAAHAQGFVHRDLKPENVFITSRHSNPHLVKLLDFGIAKNTRTTPNGLRTQNGAVLGTPVYMAAEQYEDAGRVDARADIFSLGVLAYVMLSGQYPFGAPTENWMALYNRQRYDSPQSLPSHVPSRVQQAIYRALAFDPAARPQAAQEFVVELALGTPDDPLEPSGVEIVRQVASELLLTGPASETTRSPHAAELARALWPRAGGTPSPGHRHDSGSSASTPASRAAATANARPLGATPPYLQANASATPNAYPIVTAESPRTTLSAASGPIPSPAATAPPPSTRRRPLLMAAGALVAIGAATAAVVLVLQSRRDEPAATPVSAAGPADAALAPAPVAATSMPDAAPAAPVDARGLQTVTIETVPAGADLVIDGGQAGTSPVTIERTVGAKIEVRAERRGYRTESESFAIGRDTKRLELRLAAKAEAKDRDKGKPTSTPPAATSSTRKPPPDASTRSSTFNPDDVVGD